MKSDREVSEGFLRFVKDALASGTIDPLPETAGRFFAAEEWVPKPTAQRFHPMHAQPVSTAAPDPRGLFNVEGWNRMEELARMAWRERIAPLAVGPELLKLLTFAVIEYQTRRVVFLPRDRIAVRLSALPGIYALTLYGVACNLGEADISSASSGESAAAVRILLAQIDGMLADATPADTIALHLLCGAFSGCVDRLGGHVEALARRDRAIEFGRQLVLRSPMTRLMAAPCLRFLSTEDTRDARGLAAVLRHDMEGIRCHLVQEMMRACCPADGRWEPGGMGRAGSVLVGALATADSSIPREQSFRIRMYALRFFNMFALVAEEPGRMEALTAGMPGDTAERERLCGDFSLAFTTLQEAAQPPGGGFESGAADAFRLEYARFRGDGHESLIQAVRRYISNITTVGQSVSKGGN